MESAIPRAPQDVLYALDSEEEGAGVLDRLAGRFRVQREAAVQRGLVVYDTFDARLYRSGRALVGSRERGGRELRLVALDGRALLAARHAGEPDFAWNLPDGELRRCVRECVRVRRVLPRVEVEARETTLAVLDELDKTVCRVRVETGRVRRPSDEALPGPATAGDTGPRDLPARLRVEPLRGYGERAAEVARFLELTLGLARAESAGPSAALEALGRTPRPPAPVRLDPAAPAQWALRAVLRQQLETIVANEPGVVADVDTEFLHELRVAVRRTRSVLGQISGVFPEEPAARFADAFAWLGEVTGPLRDLDVQLLDLREELDSTSNGAARALAPLVEHLRARRTAEHGALAAALRSERCRRLLAEWTAFLAEPAVAGEPPPDALRPVAQVVAARVRAVHRRILKRGRGVGRDSPPRALHRVRIQGKKLRYLIDCFRSLWERDAVDALLGDLKRLQDVLGEFNDLEVQREALARAAAELHAAGGAPLDTLLAVGAAIERLGRRSRKVRRRFAERFDRFDSGRTERHFEALLGERDGS